MQYDELVEFIKRYGRLFWLFTAIGLLFFSYHYLDDLARMQHGTLPRRLIEEMTGVYTALILLLFVIWFARRFPWPLQIFGALAYSGAHTTLMALTRAALFPLAGLGHYDYGIMFFRYPMEASQDLIVYPIVVGFVYFLDRTRAAREAEISAAQLQRELAEAKLENLRLQLHPHFLFNTLNAVSAVMYEDVRKADAMLAKLSDFLRIILNSTDVRVITLDEELQIERTYVEIMKARLEHALELWVNVDPDVRLARVPVLILQPILENSIRHGVGADASNLEIAVEARRDGRAVEIHVRDNGIGVTNNSAVASGGRGLANVRSRLAHLYGDSFSLSVGQLTPCGTDICITLPFQS
jgi:two-component system, LytTR family, sensor kinase